jgi:hypothetical protein
LIKLNQIKNFFSQFKSTKVPVGRSSKLDIAELATINWLQARYRSQALKALYQYLLDNCGQL